MELGRVLVVLATVCCVTWGQNAVVVKEPPTNMTVLTGSNMTQLCTPVSYTGFFEWRYYSSVTDINGHQIYNYPPYKGNTQYPTSKYRQVDIYGLAAYSMALSDGGLYSCGFLEEDTRAYATVVVIGAPLAVITPAECDVGANVILVCSVQFGGPANGSNNYLPTQFPQLNMLFNGQQVIDTTTNYTPAIDHTQPHLLTLVSRMVVSTSDAGRKLECQVSTQAPAFSVTTATPLNVRVPVYEMKFSPFNSQYVVNDVVTCSAQGYPPPVIQWLPVTMPSSSGALINGPYLNLTSNLVGSNVWNCTANQPNAAKLSHQISFTVLDKDTAEAAQGTSNAMIGLGVGLAIGISLLLTGIILLIAFLIKRRNRGRAKKSSLGASESVQPFIYNAQNSSLSSTNPKMNPEADYRPGNKPVPKPRIASTTSTLEPVSPSLDQSIDKPYPSDRSNTPLSMETDKSRSARKARPTYRGSQESLDRSVDSAQRPVPAQRPPTSIRASQESLNRSLDPIPRPSQHPPRTALTGSQESLEKVPQPKPRPFPATRASNESLDRSLDSDGRPPRPSHRAKFKDTDSSLDSGVRIGDRSRDSNDQSGAGSRGKPRPPPGPGVAPKPAKQRGQAAAQSDQSNSTDV